MTTNNLNGALTGIALTAAAHWARYDHDTQRRLRNVRIDAEEALDLVREMQGRGEVVRLGLPTVMDAQVGIALASPQPAPAAVVPSTGPAARPDLSRQMETAVADMTWPPEPGEYDDRGLVKRAGELTSMFLALTYEEVRAFVQGLTQERSPSRESKPQIFYAANALVAQLCEQRLTWKQYKDLWARFFGGQAVAQGPQQPAPLALVPLHQDPTRPPAVLKIGPGIASCTPLSSQAIAGYPFANRNTDEAMALRITVGPNPVPAGSPVVAVQYGTAYRYRASNGTLVPMQPAVMLNQPELRLDSVTSTGFVLASGSPLAANSILDVQIMTGAGQATE